MADRNVTVLNPAGYQEQLPDTDNIVLTLAPSANNHGANKKYVDDRDVILENKIDQKIDQEILDRIAGDQGQSDRLDQEIIDREEGDASLQGQIDTINSGGIDARYVSVAGDNMSGALTINGNNIRLNLDGSADFSGDLSATGKFIGGSSSTGETLFQNETGSVTWGSVYAFGTSFLGSGVKSGTNDPYTFECTFAGNAQRVAYTQETTGAAATTGHSFWGAISKNNFNVGATVSDMRRRFYLDTKDTTIFLGPDLDLTKDPATQANIQLIGSNGSAVFNAGVTASTLSGDIDCGEY